MAANTKEFPKMDISNSGALRTQIITIMASGLIPMSLFSKSTFLDAFIVVEV